MTHHVANPETGLRPMHFGRAMHMDLARANDVDLDRALRFLDQYDTDGKASAYTQDMIDDRIDDINCEGDRRAGVTYVVVDRKPRSFWHPPTEPVNAADADAQDEENPAELTNDGEDDGEDAPAEDVPTATVAVRPLQLTTRGQRRLFDALDAVAFDPAQVPALIEDARQRGVDVTPFMDSVDSVAVDGLVPGETSSM